MAGKLWLAFGLVVLFLAFSSVVSYHSIQNIERDLLRVVAVEEPLEEAVMEMEINAGETVRAVFGYVRDLEPAYLAVMRESGADFDRFAAYFERLATTDEERRLGREVAGFYEKFKTLGDEIVALADWRYGILAAFRRDVLEIDEMIDEKLRKTIDTTASHGIKKLRSAYEMEINIDEAFAAIEGYVLRPNPDLLGKSADAKADVERFEALYRETGLSAKETAWLDRIVQNFAQALAAGNEIISITNSLRARLAEFEDILARIDAVLDDEIQPLIHAKTVAAADDAKSSVRTAALYLLVLGFLGLCVASISAWIVYRGIIGPVRVLVRGTEIVRAGNLDHRIDIGSKDEIGHLASAFNRMLENLARAMQERDVDRVSDPDRKETA